MNKIFAVFLCIAACNAAMAGDCTNPEYARAHTFECKKFDFTGTTTLAIGGAVAAAGGVAAAIASMGHGGGGSTPDAQPYAAPTARTYYVGTDIDSATLSAVQQRYEYTKNTIAYDEINLAYSIARGFTGKNSTIAVIDSGNDTWHGQTVAKIAGGPIAPDATIKTYKVTDASMNFIPYSEIGAVIRTTDANIFNNSWNINMAASAITTRTQIENITTPEFISDIANTAKTRDAIFVFAAGNNGWAQSGAMSALPRVVNETRGHVVNVVAFDTETNQLADFSNACGVTKEYCITAPGTNISVGIIPASGTSFAAPIVSAAIATIRQAFPYMTATQITELLFTTARDLGNPGVDDIYGHGMLDLESATRPVGAPVIAITETQTVPMRAARIPGTMAHNIKNADVKLAYFDKFGRAFNTNIDDNIKIQNPGRGFSVLRDKNNNHMNIGNIEMGFMSSDFLAAYGFIGTDNRTSMTYMAINDSFNIGNAQIHPRAQFGIMRPRPSDDSIIADFSNIYTTTLSVDAYVHDFHFGISAPDMITNGYMKMHVATARANTGEILFTNYNVPMRSRPSIEYSLGYKFITAAFVDNPYGSDEFYVIAKSKLRF
ncbi:MAG: S8 family serine peptidase [Alphaproteobacteria bacterium]|nr:S8 family serine peptidase [Alphaproteobacteria bacterium]